jgi:hypothetical protein
MSDTDGKSEENIVEKESAGIGVTSPFPPNNTTEGLITKETQHEERQRRRKRFLRRMKSASPLVLIIVFWVTMLVALVMSMLGNDYSDIPAGVGLGIIGLLLIFLGLSVIDERKITSSFSDDYHALEETYAGKDAVMLGWFYIFLGILFLCGSGYVFYLRFAD